MKWEPVATAPKDGSDLLTCWWVQDDDPEEYTGWQYDIAHWSDGAPDWIEPGWVFDTGYSNDQTFEYWTLIEPPPR